MSDVPEDPTAATPERGHNPTEPPSPAAESPAPAGAAEEPSAEAGSPAAAAVAPGEPESPKAPEDPPAEAEAAEAEAEAPTAAAVEPGETESPAAPPAPAPAVPAGAEPAPPPKRPGISIGALAKPKGGPLAVVTRIGILVVAIILVIALVFAGIAAINGLGGKGRGNAVITPTPSPSGETYYNWQNPQGQYSIDRPTDWTVRVLSGPTDPNITLAIGPPSPYPVQDFVAILVEPINETVPSSQLIPFKDSILKHYIGSDATVVSQSPVVTSGALVGYTFEWSAPAASPTTLYAGYFLLNGNRFIVVQLRVQPASDAASFLALSPTFNHIANSLLSFYNPPSPTSTATTAPTSTASP